MREQFRFRAMAAVLIVVLLAPPLLAFAAPSRGRHDCCGPHDGFKVPPARAPQCCVISAPHAPQPLGPVASLDVSAPLAACHSAVEISAHASSTASPVDIIDPSPPRCSSVLRI